MTAAMALRALTSAEGRSFLPGRFGRAAVSPTEEFPMNGSSLVGSVSPRPGVDHAADAQATHTGQSRQ